MQRINVECEDKHHEMLLFVAKHKYRSVSKSQALRLLIEDAFVETKKEVESREVDERQ